MNVRNLETIDFRTLSIFVTTCQLLNLTQCAERLGLPKSTVSKEITRLESHLQVKLLERSTRSVSTTEAGQIVYERAVLLVEDFMSLRHDILDMEQQVQGLLRIAAPPGLGEYLTTELIACLLRRWPKLRISLELSYAFEDLFQQGIDAAFRVGDIADDRLIARKLGTSTRVLVATEEYLKCHPVITQPSDLTQHNCMRFLYSPSESDWVLQKNNQAESVAVCGNFFCANIQSLKQAVIEGIGIAQMPVNSIRKELECGQLVRVLAGWQVPSLPIHLVYRTGVNKPKKLAALLALLDEQPDLFNVDLSE